MTQKSIPFICAYESILQSLKHPESYLNFYIHTIFITFYFLWFFSQMYPQVFFSFELGINNVFDITLRYEINFCLIFLTFDVSCGSNKLNFNTTANEHATFCGAVGNCLNMVQGRLKINQEKKNNNNNGSGNTKNVKRKQHKLNRI